MSRALPVRRVHVVRAGNVTPHMRRVVLGGDDLADLVLDGPDQQVKLYFPKPGQREPRLPEPGDDGDWAGWYQRLVALPEDERPWARSYTLRAHDPAEHTVTVDFVLHPNAGPATRWAAAAAPGAALGMFGPSPDFARRVPLTASFASARQVLLAGDETAVPALGTLAEALPEGLPTVAYIETAGPEDEVAFPTRGDLTVHWLHRGDTPAGRAGLLGAAVRAADLRPDGLFAWLAGEAGAVRDLRRHLVGDRGVPKNRIDFAGYWRLDLTQDDAPTDADMAEARERLADAAEAETTKTSAL
ncbi:siderophore-interacting protein [Actinomadura fibrosa]|uniref:Siderophore-interacting protein n=1 Tax=Actinomadura fibrosa TaxID=111802 RepID=A0ABW2XYJ4_9ACTN|nr:siderophore-interacting protein [Actinomadura fibrosa]